MERPLLKAFAPSARSRRYRIPEIDVLRGFALFGVFLVNIFAFGGDASAWTSHTDQLAWSIKHIFFESKFWGLFSLLFGISCWLQWRGHARFWVVVRRLLFLFFAGVINALFFEGDILMLYAQLGFVLLLIHRLPNQLLLAIAVALFLVFPIAHGLNPDRGEPDYPDDPAEAAAWLQEDREDGIYVANHLGEIVAWHVEALPEVPWADYQWPDSGLVVLAMFLCGFVVARAGLLERCLEMGRQSRQFAILAWVSGLSLMGLERWLSVTVGYRVFGEAIDSFSVQLVGDISFALATLSLVVGWFLTVLLVSRRYADVDVVKAIEAMGRMSLTMYLLQTVIIVAVFYGPGFGLAYSLGPAPLLLLAVITYAVQLVLARIWFQIFQVGPMEWLWRWASEGSRRPLRVRPRSG